MINKSVNIACVFCCRVWQYVSASWVIPTYISQTDAGDLKYVKRTQVSIFGILLFVVADVF